MGKRQRGKTEKRNDAGVLPTNFPKPTRWKLDYDYLQKLSPTEREWLARFSDAYYGGDFGGEKRWDQNEKRQAWSEQRATRQDAYGLATIWDGYISADLSSLQSNQRDWDHTADYLNDDEYKAARERYRKTLSPSRAPVHPKDTQMHKRMRRALDVITPPPPEPEFQDE